MKKVTFLIFMMALSFLCALNAGAQETNPPSKIEVGVQFTTLPINPPKAQGLGALTSIRTDEPGFGGRFTFNLNKNFALEAEGNFFPHETSFAVAAGGRMLQGQFGVKAGKRFGRFGFFAKARPGFISSSKVLTQVGTNTFDIEGRQLTLPVVEQKRQTYFSMDLGGVFEFYPSRRVFTRIDAGDTLIHYREGPVFPFGPLWEARTSHNLQLIAGVGFRLGSILPPDPTPHSQGQQQQRFEVGAQFSSLSLTQFDHFTNSTVIPFLEFRDSRTQLGFGGRLTYNLTSSFAVETEGNFFPRDNALFNNHRAGGRLLQWQAGVKAGKRFETFGIFAKARPGIVSFSNTPSFLGFDEGQDLPIPFIRFKRRNSFSFDLGGVLEFYPSRRLITRFDLGDTIIRYGSTVLPFGLGPEVIATNAETMHNFQFSAGVGFRF